MAGEGRWTPMVLNELRLRRITIFNF